MFLLFILFSFFLNTFAECLTCLLFVVFNGVSCSKNQKTNLTLSYSHTHTHTSHGNQSTHIHTRIHAYKHKHKHCHLFSQLNAFVAIPATVSVSVYPFARFDKRNRNYNSRTWLRLSNMTATSTVNRTRTSKWTSNRTQTSIELHFEHDLNTAHKSMQRAPSTITSPTRRRAVPKSRQHQRRNSNNNNKKCKHQNRQTTTNQRATTNRHRNRNQNRSPKRRRTKGKRRGRRRRRM